RSVLSILQEAASGAEQAAPDLLKLPLVLRIPFFHRLFSREREMFEKVRAALTAFALTVEFVRAYRGAKMTEKLEESRRTERTAEIKLFLEGQLKLKGISKDSAEGSAALSLSTSFINKWSQTLESKLALEHEVTVNADLATEALNGFFTATTAA